MRMNKSYFVREAKMATSKFIHGHCTLKMALQHLGVLNHMARYSPVLKWADYMTVQKCIHKARKYALRFENSRLKFSIVWKFYQWAVNNKC